MATEGTIAAAAGSSGFAARWRTRLAPPLSADPPRWLTVVLLAPVLSLDSADRSTLSAVGAGPKASAVHYASPALRWPP